MFGSLGCWCLVFGSQVSEGQFSNCSSSVDTVLSSGFYGVSLVLLVNSISISFLWFVMFQRGGR